MKLDAGVQRIGALTLYMEPENLYTDEHLHLLSLINEPAAIALSNALKHQELLRMKEILADDNRLLREQLFHISGNTIVGQDGGLKDVMGMVRKVAGMDRPIFLLGETGESVKMTSPMPFICLQNVGTNPLSRPIAAPFRTP